MTMLLLYHMKSRHLFMVNLMQKDSFRTLQRSGRKSEN